MKTTTTHLKEPKFYPAGYLVTTLTSLLFLAAITGLGAMLIDYWINGVSSFLNDVMVMFWVASLAVVTPLHLFFYWQVRHADKSRVTTFSLRFANGLLGAYLLAVVGSFIVLGTWLVALWLNVLFGTGDADKHLLAATLSIVQAIVWLAYAFWHFSRARTDESRPKYYAITISLLSVVILALSIAFPVLAYRNVAHDLTKQNDLAHINQAIGEYVDTHNTLPVRLADLQDLPEHTKDRLHDYQYQPHGETNFGIFGYGLCAEFARSNEKGRDLGLGFSSHSAGKQCFARTTISFTKMNQELTQALDNDVHKLQAGIQTFLLSAKNAVNQEVVSIENYAGGQVKQLEENLEGLQGGTTALQQEMQRLEGNLGGLEGNTGDLAQDFAAVEKFLHDLGCLFGGCTNR